MTELSERLALLEEKSNGNGFCALAKIINSIDDASKEIMERLLKNQSVSTRSIAIELQNAGYRIDRQTVSAHRHYRCVCVNKKEVTDD